MDCSEYSYWTTDFATGVWNTCTGSHMLPVRKIALALENTEAVLQYSSTPVRSTPCRGENLCVSPSLESSTINGQIAQKNTGKKRL
jgi:hypothetical protein